MLITNARIRELCGVRNGLDERIDEGILQWFSHVERMERDRIAKRVYFVSVLESCMRHCLCLFLCMAVRQCYGKRRRDLE